MRFTAFPAATYGSAAAVAAGLCVVCVVCVAAPSLSQQAAAPTPLPVPVSGKKATVLLFVTPDCPIANQYAPEMARLHTEFGRRGVAFYAVYADPEVTESQAKGHAREFGLRFPVLPDSKYRLVERVGVTVTPEAAVCTPDGRLRYRGRIDDRYPRLGQRREQVTRRELRDALGAILAGKAVRVPTTRAIGCFIPSIDGKESTDDKP